MSAPQDGVTGKQAGFELVCVVARFKAIGQYKRPGETSDRDTVLAGAPVVVRLDRRYLNGQQPPLAGFGVEQPHVTRTQDEGGRMNRDGTARADSPFPRPSL